MTYYFYAVHLLQMGRLAEAEAAVRRALQVDPLSVFHNATLGTMFLFRRQYEAAVEQYRKTLEIDPSFAFAHAWLASALLHSGRQEEAVAQLQQGLTLSGGDMWMRCLLATFEGLVGHKEKALAHLQEILSLAERRYVSPVHLSQAYFGLGDFNKAFELLENAFKERDPGLRAVLAIPGFRDAVGGDPRYQDLVHRIRTVSAASRSSAA